MYQKRQGNKNLTNSMLLLIIMLIYKLALELGFWFLLSKAYGGLGVYRYDFNLGKYLLGFIWCFLLFAMIRHDIRKPSVFFLELEYFMAIIPITVIFAFSNENVLYYTGICSGFAVAEIIVWLGRDIVIPKINLASKAIIIAFYFITIIVYITIVLQNGMFSLKALDIYEVYSVRSEFHLNKYVGYLFNWQYTIITPFFIVRAIDRKKYLTAIAFCGMQFLAYLYAAQKNILFVIPLVVGIAIVSNLRSFNTLAFCGLSLGTALVTALGFKLNFFYQLYDLFVRRVLILSANLKFIYYDYFSTHTLIGLAGTLWGKFLGIEFPYEERIGIIISTEYFNKPEMNSNTGFWAEGYYRFGLFGILLVGILFALLILVIDEFAKWNGYSFALGISFFAIFTLNDGGIIDPIIFGPLTVLIFLCLFYNKGDDFKKLRMKTEYSKI